MAPDTLSERFLYPLHRALPHALSSRAAGTGQTLQHHAAGSVQAARTTLTRS
jgi:hypothetical protein